MKCPNCGAEITGPVCEYCGTQINNPQGCCKRCGSPNLSFKRENQGEIKGKKANRIVHRTVGVCKDCGYTWYEDETPEPKRKTWLWVLEWIFIFPLPLTILLAKNKKMKTWLKILIIAAAWIAYLLIAFAGKKSDNAVDNKVPGQTAEPAPTEQVGSNTNQNTNTPKPEQETGAPIITAEPTPAPQEIDPDVPLGTVYVLNQGNYECGEDIPEGRYKVEWDSGNQFGGYLSATNNAKYLDSSVSIDPGVYYTCLLSPGDTFEITLSSLKFTKISSLPNNDYLQEDGTYLFGSGFYFEGIDIPLGKYNVTSVGGNQFGIYVSTKNNSFLSLEQDETYNNLKLNHEGCAIEISLGEARFTPAG